MEPNLKDLVPKPAAKEIARWKNLIKKNEICRRPIKKYRVVKKTDLDKLFHKVNIEKSIFYNTELGRNNISTEENHENHYLTKLLFDTERQDKEELDTEIPVYKIPKAFNEPSFEKDVTDLTYSSEIDDEVSKDVSEDLLKYNSNIKDRIFVPEKKYGSSKGITDVDEKYFSIVQKRCKRCNLTKQDYLCYLRESLRLRLQTGYVFDEIFKINEQAEIEKTKFKQVKMKLKNYSVSFDEYLAEEHNESMKPILAYAEEVTLTDKKRKLLKKKLYLASSIRFSIYDLEESWRKSKLCEDFLLEFFSILSGKSSSTLEVCVEEVEERRGSTPYDHSRSNSITSLMHYAASAPTEKNAHINFEHPEYLLEILTLLEHQCLDYLTFTELLEKPNMTISIHLDLITKMFTHEVATVKQNISSLSNLIRFIETNNQTLEAHVNLILYGLFKETFSGAEESISLNEYLRQTYKRCVTTSSEISVSSLQMMHGIVKEYATILLEMDCLPTDKIKKLVKDVGIREINRLVIAKNARRKVREFQTLTEQMLKLFRPIVLKKRRKLLYRSMPPTAKEPPPPLPVEMGEEEKEYLYLFTDFCPYKDDENIYLSKRDIV